jgi:hypothetical protein
VPCRFNQWQLERGARAHNFQLAFNFQANRYSNQKEIQTKNTDNKMWEDMGGGETKYDTPCRYLIIQKGNQSNASYISIAKS